MKIEKISNMNFNSQTNQNKEQINFFDFLDRKLVDKNFIDYILNFFHLYKKKKYINLTFKNKYDLEMIYIWLFEFIQLYNEMLKDELKTDDEYILQIIKKIKLITKSYEFKLNNIGINILNNDDININKQLFINSKYDDILEIIQGEHCYLENINFCVNNMNNYIDDKYKIQ